MRNPVLFSRIFNTPLMIQATKLDAIVAGIGGRFGLEIGANHDLPQPDAALISQGEKKSPGYEVIGSVAVINLFGVLAHRGGIDANSNYILGYDWIGKRMDAALADPDVKSILLQIDSPGGEVAGAFEMAAMIKQAQAIKPVKAVVSSMAASAGYLLASGAGEIAISDTGIAGSIGVVLRHIDLSKAAEMDGISVTYIYAGDRKIDGNPFQPLPDNVKADLQTQIDKLYSLFVTTVAANRNLTTEQVRAQQAQIYTGQDAIDAGLADRIATPDEMLADMQKLSTNQRSIFMGTQNPDNTALEQQALDKARADGFEAGKIDGRLEGEKTGAKAERERIGAILNHAEAKGRESQAIVMALETDMSAEQAGKLLAASPKASAKSEPGKDFAAAMAAIGNPKLGPGDGDDEGGDPDETESARGWAAAVKPYAINGGRSGAKS